jgi:hypothetical protein
MKLDEAFYRNIYHQFMYIECPDDLADLSGTIEIIPGATGIAAYCYVEDLVGTSFMILASAIRTKEGVKTGPMTQDNFPRVRFADVEKDDFILARYCHMDTRPYRDVPSQVMKYFESSDKKITMLRDLAMLDQFRNIEFPDFVTVNLSHDDLLSEAAWVRVDDFGRDVFFGTLAERPKQEFGLRKDDRIAFRAISTGSGITLYRDPTYIFSK